MKRNFHTIVAPVLICAGMIATLSPSAFAQTEQPPSEGPRNPPTNLSDVSGPFLGNITLPPLPIGISSIPGTSIAQLDTATVGLIDVPTESGLGPVLSATVQLSSTMDGLMPFAGCSNVNWRSYNEAVADAKELKKVLAEAVVEQKKAYIPNPTPEQRLSWTQRLVLIEQTTNALDAATKTLAYLGDAMDKSR